MGEEGRAVGLPGRALEGSAWEQRSLPLRVSPAGTPGRLAPQRHKFHPRAKCSAILCHRRTGHAPQRGDWPMAALRPEHVMRAAALPGDAGRIAIPVTPRLDGLHLVALAERPTGYINN